MQFIRVAFIAVSVALCADAFAQLQPASVEINGAKTFTLHTQDQVPGNARTQQCNADTVYYGYAKATNLQALDINTVTSADKAGQWFDAPQNLMVYGFTFFAWVRSQTDDTVTLTCKLIIAGPDSLPTGPVAATATVLVDSTFKNGNLNVLEKTALFSSPVLINFPYILVVETTSPLNVALVTNDWDSIDGAKEWLGMASLPGIGWRHGYDLNVGGVSFDADFVFNPIVTYEIEAEFTADPPCFANGSIVQFTNTTESAVLQSRFYNQYVFNETQHLIYAWDYGDGSPIDLVTDTLHVYAPGNDYSVTLRSAILGWSRLCQTTATRILNPATESDFNYTQNGLTVHFSNAITGSDTAHLWNFSDGATSTDENPVHVFPADGIYEVSLIALGACSADTATKSISVCNPLTSGYTFNVSGREVDFAVTAISGSASFTWNFGDGSFGNGLSASHTYSSSGAYNTCLVVSNSCDADTTCQQVIVLSTGNEGVWWSGWEAYPNPSSDKIALHFKNEIPQEVHLSDITGKIVKSLIINEKAVKFVLDISNLSPGTYYLKAKFAENKESGRVVVIR